MSSSVVRQLVTETRIAARPAQVVPPSQHVPSRWTASITARVRRSPAVPSGSSPSASNRTRVWLSTTSLRIRTPRTGRQALGHPARERAVALDEVDEPGPPERSERGEDREPARPARRFGRPVVVVALAALGLDVVRGAEGHRRVVGRGVADEDEPRVVRHVEPLVGVGRPRIGLGGAGHQVAQRRDRGGPDPERAIDVDPGAALVGDRDQLLERIEGTGVHVARLERRR